MQLAENVNPDDDLPVDNVCAQISDEEDSGEEVHFKSQSRTKNLMNAVRKVIQKVEFGSSRLYFVPDDDLLFRIESHQWTI